MNKIYQKMTPDVKNPAKGKIGGFTLIELLVVVLIIGILAAVALPKYEVAVGRARVAKALPVLRALYEAKQAYYLATGEHTGDLDSLDISVPYTSRVLSDSGAMYSYNGTPIGRVTLSNIYESVYWPGPGFTIDISTSKKWFCYSSADNNGKTGEKICATLGPKTDIVSIVGTPTYKVIF